MIDTATIERLAREAGFKPYSKSLLDGKSPQDQIAYVGEYPCGEKLARFAALVADHERERCAKAVELMSLRTDDSEGATNALKWAAEDIRAL